jgi:DNA-binding response OmpR family regulator
MKRRILLVDDEVAVLLTLKAVLEISGFDVDTAASGREGKLKLRSHEYHMVITDMRMENDEAGAEVVEAARKASYHPAIAMLTAFPLADEDWESLGADKMLVKPMQTRILLQQIEKLLASHEAKLSIWSSPAPTTEKGPGAPAATAKPAIGKPPTKRVAGKPVPKGSRAAKVKSTKATVKKATKPRWSAAKGSKS